MSGARVVLMSDPDNNPEDYNFMQFRLTYEGPLYATQREPVEGQKDPRGAHKHAIRKAFHLQLKRFWAVNRNLNGSPTMTRIVTEDSPTPPPKDAKRLAERYDMFGWNFVPLVTEPLSLICGLEILFLRPSSPGGVIRSGDIDNRLKTLFDAMKIPDAHDRYVDHRPAESEQPFYVLLEDDKLITHLSVETDELLQPVGTKFDINDVRLVISVKIRPYFVAIGNDHFS